MSRYKSAAMKKRERRQRGAVLKIALATLVLIGIGAVYVRVSSSRPSLNPVTLCPASPGSITVLLVDVTDPMSLPQRQDFANQLERLQSSIPQFGKLAVFKVDPLSDQLLRPVIERCNPGTAKDFDDWTGNPAGAQKKWDESFKAPLDNAFAEISTASGATRSPILESIQSIALTELKKPEADGKPKRLIIASDLLQNTDRITFYGKLPNPDQVLNSDAFRLFRTDLRGVKMELWMLERSDTHASQPRALIDLWDALLTEQGADLTRVYRVSG